MKRLHVHVAVDDLAQSVGFYSALFAAKPAIVKPDMAKWMLDDPTRHFAISARGQATGLDHLGIQVETQAELQESMAACKKLIGRYSTRARPPVAMRNQRSPGSLIRKGFPGRRS